LFRYYVFVCIPPGKVVTEMTYTVLSGTLKPILTHSLSPLQLKGNKIMQLQNFALQC